MGKYSKLSIIDSIAANLQNNTAPPSGAVAGDIALINYVLYVYNGTRWVPVSNLESFATVSSDSNIPAMFSNVNDAFNAGYRRFLLVGDVNEPTGATGLSSSEPISLIGINTLRRSWNLNGNVCSYQNAIVENLDIAYGQWTSITDVKFNNCTIGVPLTKNPSFLIKLIIENSDIFEQLIDFDSVSHVVFINNCKYNLAAFTTYNFVGTISNSSIFSITQTLSFPHPRTKLMNCNLLRSGGGTITATLNISSEEVILDKFSIDPGLSVIVNISGKKNIISGFIYDNTPPNQNQVININSGAQFNKIIFNHGFNINDNSGNNTNIIFGNTV